MGIFDKAKDAMSGQQDKVDAGVERAGDMVDDRTESKYAEQVTIPVVMVNHACMESIMGHYSAANG